jgi:hypothetical protein
MTMDNYKEAKYVLFDLKIIPFAKMIAKEENEFLMRRYDKTGRYELGFDPKEISALQTLRDARNKIKIDSGALTINEIRNLYDLAEVDGGDVIYMQANLIPMGSSVNDPASLDKFRKALLGTGKFTQEEIDKKVKNVYG